MSNDVYLNGREAAVRLNVTVKTLANWRSDKSGAGPEYRRYGNRIYYTEAELERWICSRTFTSTADYTTPPPAASKQSRSDDARPSGAAPGSTIVQPLNNQGEVRPPEPRQFAIVSGLGGRHLRRLVRSLAHRTV